MVRAIIKKKIKRYIKILRLYSQFLFIYCHNYIYIYSNGRIGKTLAGRPCLILHSTGAKTKLQRKNVLSYLKESNSFCIVASNGGREKNPSWYHNLISNPECKIQIGRKILSGNANQIHDEEYIEWWSKMDNMNKGGYSNYQKMTKRKIPLILISVT